MLPKKLQINIQSELNNLWSYWKSLGVFTNGKTQVICPEEAFIGLCILGRFDQRLYDEGISIVSTHIKLLSLNKLKYWHNRLDPLSQEFFNISSELVFRESGDRKIHKISGPTKSRAAIRNIKPRPFFYSINGQPLFAGMPQKGFFYHNKWLRNEFVLSSNTPDAGKIAGINPWIKAKLTFGNSVIADTVVLVSSNDSISAPDISRRTGYTGKSIWLVLRDLENAGWLISSKKANRILYRLSDNGRKLFKSFRTSGAYLRHFENWIRLGFLINAIFKLPSDASDDLIRSEELKIENALLSTANI